MARNSIITANITMGDLAVTIVASGTSYSPDIADDIARRAIDIWRGTLGELDEYELLDNGDDFDFDDDDEDEDEFGPVPGRELQDPRIVRFMEDWGDSNA